MTKTVGAGPDGYSLRAWHLIPLRQNLALDRNFKCPAAVSLNEVASHFEINVCLLVIFQKGRRDKRCSLQFFFVL